MRILRHSSGWSTLCSNGVGGSVPALKKFVDYSLGAPDQVSCDMIMITGGPIIQMFTYNGPLEEAKAERKTWQTLGKSVIGFSK